MTKNKTRNIFIDCMKGILIILVVIGHLPFFDYNSRTLTLIYGFHMPAFLIIGGILSHIDEDTKLKHVIFKRIISTLIPYYVFYIIAMFIVPLPDWEARIAAIKIIIKGIGIPPDKAVDLPLWFLTYYFCAMTIYEFIEILCFKIKIFLFGRKKRLGNKKILTVRMMTFIIISFIMYAAFFYARILKAPRLPYNFEIACFSLGFVFFGKIIGELFTHAITYIESDSLITFLFCIIITIFIFIITYSYYYLAMYNGRIDLNARDYKNANLMYIDAIFGFLIISFISYIVSVIPIIKSIISCIGENSLYILAYHVPTAVFTYKVLIPLVGPALYELLSVNSPISIFILTTLGIVYSLIFGIIHKTIHFPK